MLIRRFIGCAVAVATAWITTAQDGEAGAGQSLTEVDFDRALADVDELFGAEQWAQAEARILELAKQHADSSYVVLRRHELQKRLENALFWPTAKLPSLQSLMDVRVESYRESSGDLRLTYQLGDLKKAWKDIDYVEPSESEEGSPSKRSSKAHRFVLELPFQKLEELKFKVIGDQQRIVFGAGREGSLKLDLGDVDERRGREKRVSPPRFITQDGERVGRGKTVPDKPDEGYELRVTFKGKALDVFVAGKRAVKHKHKVELSPVLLMWKPNWIRGLEAKGEIDEDWLRLKRDAYVEEQRANSPVERVAQRKLNSLLGIELKSYAEADPQDIDACVDESLPRNAVKIAAVIEAANAGTLHEAFHRLDTLADHEISTLERKLLSAQLYFQDGKLEECRQRLDAVLKIQPKCELALWVRAQTYLASQDLVAARRSLEALLEFDSLSGWAYANLPDLDLILDNKDSAKQRLREALEAGRFGLESDETSEQITRAVEGPGWSRRFSVASDHYKVISNINKRTSIEAADVLEIGLKHFSEALIPVKLPKGERFQTFLFRGEAGFNGYFGSLSSQRIENAAGLYSSRYDQLLIWEQPDREAFLRTVRHEGFHQYLDALIEDPPIWFNEGLAEYFEAADFTKSTSNQIPLRKEYLVYMVKPPIPWSEFIHIDPRSFYMKADAAYPQAWGLVYYLRHSSRENRELFTAMLEAMHSGEPGAEVVERLLGGKIRLMGVEMSPFFWDLAMPGGKR